MNSSSDEIKAQISTTRASIDRSVDRLAARFDPRMRIGPEPLKRLGAMAAVGAGVVMLVRNVLTLRRRGAARRRTAIPVL
jgi:hypothetical protein